MLCRGTFNLANANIFYDCKSSAFSIIFAGGKRMNLAAKRIEDTSDWGRSVKSVVFKASQIHIVNVSGQRFEVERRYIPLKVGLHFHAYNV